MQTRFTGVNGLGSTSAVVRESGGSGTRFCSCVPVGAGAVAGRPYDSRGNNSAPPCRNASPTTAGSFLKGDAVKVVSQLLYLLLYCVADLLVGPRGCS